MSSKFLHPSLKLNHPELNSPAPSNAISLFNSYNAFNMPTSFCPSRDQFCHKRSSGSSVATPSPPRGDVMTDASKQICIQISKPDRGGGKTALTVTSHHVVNTFFWHVWLLLGGPFCWRGASQITS